MSVQQLPKLDWYQEQMLQARKKREELVKRRDRLNVRIESIDNHLASLQPEEVERRKKAWENLIKEQT
jgi:hypothetical protein